MTNKVLMDLLEGLAAQPEDGPLRLVARDVLAELTALRARVKALEEALDDMIKYMDSRSPETEAAYQRCLAAARASGEPVWPALSGPKEGE